MRRSPVGELVGERATGAERPAFIEGTTGRGISWQDAATSIEAWAPLAGGGRIGLAIADPLDMIAAVLGALGAGVPVAPLDPVAPGAELTQRARAMGLTAVVAPTSTPDVDEALAAAGIARRAGPGDLAATDWRAARTAPSATPGNVGLIMASSGTTGSPKVIPLTQDHLLHTARSVVRHLGLGPDERGFSPLPLFHINGLVVGVLAAAVADSSLVVDRRFSRGSFWDVVERHHASWLNLVPAIISLLASDPQDPPAAVTSGVRLARSASAPLATAVAERFRARFGIPIVETYGMTEAASQITANPVHDARPGSVGRPAGVEVRVVGEHGEARAVGFSGHVEIRGASVVPAYWNEADAGETRVLPATSPDGWLTTGDIGRLDADGYLYLLGRGDDVINRGGEKVQPRDVEEVLLADPRVQAAVVVGRPHPTVGAEPVAYVLAADGIRNHHQLPDELEERCRATLSRFKRPAEIVIVDDLPAGPTGKVLRSEVRRLAGAAESEESAGAAESGESVGAPESRESVGASESSDTPAGVLSH
jgi:oxalate---CoA ligase